MGSRGHGGRSTEGSGMMRHHGSYSLSHTIEPQPYRHDNNSSNKVSEIERLAADNKRLATTHLALRQDLVATQQEIQKLRAHIGSIQTESDIQVRILLEKMAKMEVHLRAGENVKKDLQRAHNDARALVATRQDLIAQIEKATQEFDKVHADVAKIPEMQGELDGLRLEHNKLRSSFEHEKRKNTEKVSQMEVMERDLVRMAREVERLRAEVLTADKIPHVPNNVYGIGGPYMNPELYPPPPPHMHMHGGYGDGYVNHHHHHHHVSMGGGGGMNPYYGGDHHMPGGNPQWGRPPFDNSYPRT